MVSATHPARRYDDPPPGIAGRLPASVKGAPSFGGFAFAGKVHVDFIDGPARQVVLLQQPAELQQRRRIRRRFMRQIDAVKSPNRPAVVDRIFDFLV